MSPTKGSHLTEKSRQLLNGASSPKHLAQESSSHLKEHAAAGSTKKVTSEMKVRKVRSKSPPTAESGQAPVSKIKKFYEGMIPAFTNKKRQNAYFGSSKRGFTYINWDME